MVRSVCITGMGIESAFARNMNEIWQHWKDPREIFCLLKNKFREDSYFAVSKIEKINVSELYDRKIQKLTTKKDLIALLALQRSAEDAGIKKGEYDPHRLGIFVGAASTQVCDLFAYGELLQKSFSKEQDDIDLKNFGSELLSSVNPMVMMQNLMNNVLCYASIQWDARSMNRCFLDYQSAGLNAVCSAFDAIRFGYCDMAFAGGASGLADEITLEEGFRSGFIKSLNRPIVEAPLPFVIDPKGTCLSEMAAYLFLESEESAIRRGAKIYARIIAYNSAHDGVCDFSSSEISESYGLKCLNAALEIGKKSLEDISLFMSASNEVTFMDQSERHVLEQLPKACAVALPKAIFGEASEASGVLGILLGVKAIKEKYLPKSVLPKDYTGRETSVDMRRFFEAINLQKRLLAVSSKSYSRLNQCLLMEVE